MLKDDLVGQLQAVRQFFLTSTSCLTEENSTFAPTPEMMTAAQQVAHAAQSIEWFVDGAFNNPNGFDLNFEAQMGPVLKCTSLKEAFAWFNRAVDNAVKVIGAKPDAELTAPLPPGPIMAGLPKLVIVSSLADHTAHHRGALTVYSRLVGKVPKMPYGEM